MSITERDHILQAIRQIGDALARIAGMRRSGKTEAALVETQQTANGILGPMVTMIEGLDPASTVMLLGSAEKIRAYGLLVAERSAVRRALGHEEAAQADRIRALEVLGAWMKTAATVDKDVKRALEGLQEGTF